MAGRVAAHFSNAPIDYRDRPGVLAVFGSELAPGQARAVLESGLEEAARRWYGQQWLPIVFRVAYTQHHGASCWYEHLD
jgi:hypothetical protein